MEGWEEREGYYTLNFNFNINFPPFPSILYMLSEGGGGNFIQFLMCSLRKMLTASKSGGSLLPPDLKCLVIEHFGAGQFR